MYMHYIKCYRLLITSFQNHVMYITIHAIPNHKTLIINTEYWYMYYQLLKLVCNVKHCSMKIDFHVHVKLVKRPAYLKNLVSSNLDICMLTKCLTLHASEVLRDINDVLLSRLYQCMLCLWATENLPSDISYSITFAEKH